MNDPAVLKTHAFDKNIKINTLNVSKMFFPKMMEVMSYEKRGKAVTSQGCFFARGEKQTLK